MPILEVHVVEGDHSPAEHARLLELLSRRYAEVLESPLERVRAYVTVHAREHWATGGVTAANPDNEPAPYFTAIVLEGRPVEQRHRLLAEFTDLIVEVLDVTRSRVRGRGGHAADGPVVGRHLDDPAARREEIAARRR